jgi:PAS domain S-box-containing protein
MNSSMSRDTASYVRLLVDHVPSMLAYWDRDLRCRFANRAYERWFGVDPDTLPGRSLSDLLGPTLFALNEPYIRAALKGQEQTFERVVPGPDGVKRHSLATYVPDVVDGEVMGFIAHVTEVTKLKETEAALQAEVADRARAYALLRESETALREAQRLGRIGSWEWEVAPDIMIWSEELYRIFGHDPKCLPPSFAERAASYTAQSWADLQAAVTRALQTGEPYTLELEYLRPDGGTGWLEAHGEAVRGERGEVTKLRGTAHEITLRRRVDQARVQAQIAESANQNKTALLSRVSHELRTPLNAILGFAELCQMDAKLDPKYRQWAELILGSGRHMLELVNDMLDLSAAESGRITLKQVDVDLRATIRESLLRASSVAERAGLTLSCVQSGEAPIPMRADPVRLKQVVDNLLSNAIKYTRTGGAVKVSARDLGTTVEIAVEDTGIGLSAEQLDRIFLPFERLGAERTATAGTGLGLAITKRFVELMGGTVRVNSLPGVGSTFVVTLPSGRE